MFVGLLRRLVDCHDHIHSLETRAGMEIIRRARVPPGQGVAMNALPYALVVAVVLHPTPPMRRPTRWLPPTWQVLDS